MKNSILIYFALWLLISCNSTSSADFKGYVQDRAITRISDGLYIIINFNSCSSCREDLIQLLRKNNNVVLSNVTIILMGDKPTLRYYAEKDFSNYKIIKDTENDISEIFPLTLESSYLVKIIDGEIVYNNRINERIYTDEILMDYLSNINN